MALSEKQQLLAWQIISIILCVIIIMSSSAAINYHNRYRETSCSGLADSINSEPGFTMSIVTLVLGILGLIASVTIMVLKLKGILK